MLEIMEKEFQTNEVRRLGMRKPYRHIMLGGMMVIFKWFKEHSVIVKGYQKMAWKAMNAGPFLFKEPQCANVSGILSNTPTHEQDGAASTTGRRQQLLS